VIDYIHFPILVCGLIL